MLASLALATGTSVTLERPAQHAPWLNARRAASLALAGALSAAVGATSLAAAASVPKLVGTGPASSLAPIASAAPRPAARAPRPERLSMARRAVALHRTPAAHHPATHHSAAHHSAAHQSAGRRRPAPARRAAVSPAVATARALTAKVHHDVLTSLARRAVPSNLSPTIATVASGNGLPGPFWDGCFDNFTDTAVHRCLYGDPTGHRTIVLFGDSHAMMWFPAFDNLARAHHWRLVAQAKATCPPIHVRVFSPDLGEWYTQCDEWRSAVVARIARLHPAVVVLGFSREYGVLNDHVHVDGRSWMTDLRSTVRRLRRMGTDVVVMSRVPYPSGACLPVSRHTSATCPHARSINRPPAFDKAGIAAERSVVERAGGHFIDAEPWFCGPSRCAVVVGNKVVYHDGNHLAAAFPGWLTPVIGADLRTMTPASFWHR